MDISLRIALEHILVVTIRHGHKTGHINKHCPTRSKAPNSKFDKGKIEVEHIKSEMNKTWKKKDVENTSNGEGITSPNGSSDHTSTN